MRFLFINHILATQPDIHVSPCTAYWQFHSKPVPPQTSALGHGRFIQIEPLETTFNEPKPGAFQPKRRRVVQL